MEEQGLAAMGGYGLAKPDDSKATIEMPKEMLIHNYRYSNDPAYKSAIDWEAAHQHGLEDASLDIIPMGLGLASSTTKAGNALANVLTPAKVATDLGRREAIQTLGLGSLAAGMATKKAIPSIVDIAVDGVQAINRLPSGVNLSELANSADTLKQFAHALSYDDIPAVFKPLADDARQAVNNLSNKYRLEGHEIYTAADPGTRLGLSPKVSEAMTADDIVEFDKVVKYQTAARNASDSIDTLKFTRNAALSTDKPVLDLPSLMSERARTVQRLDELSKAPDTQTLVHDGSRRGVEKDVPNTGKAEKSKYLTTRLGHIDAQISKLAETGKVEPLDMSQYFVERTTPKGKKYIKTINTDINKKPDVDSRDLFENVVYNYHE